VIGDSMAGWLAHGLESAYAEDPDVAVLRNARTNSGLIRRGPRSRFNDWIATAPEFVAEAKPDFVVVMLGLSDRVPLRETAGEHARAPDANNLGTQTNPKPSAAKPSAAKAANHQFRSQRWRQLYTKRVDDMIAVLKGSGVPVLWAGIPPIRGPRSRDDLAFLNDIYRASAQNAGIPYVDMWDGFTDENGKFSIRGPDHIGQIRRLRSPDGVYFTTAGARKLGHYVERELERVIAARASALAHGGAEPRQGGPVQSGEPKARPAAGPVIPLTSLNTSAERLAGSRSGAEISPNALARRVFVSGKALPAVSGRADDFGWPRTRSGPLATIPPAAAQTGRTVPRSSLNGR
jgi:hypothetical protein